MLDKQILSNLISQIETQKIFSIVAMFTSLYKGLHEIWQPWQIDIYEHELMS